MKERPTWVSMDLS